MRLARAGARVTVVDAAVPGCGANRHNLAPVARDVRVLVEDIANAADFRGVLKSADLVFNVAGEVSHIHSMQRPRRDGEINALAQLRFLEECARQAPGIRVVYASTRQIFGAPQYLPVDEAHPVRPVDFNGIHKYAAAEYHLMYSSMARIDGVVLNLTNVYGPRMALHIPCQGFLGNFLRRALFGQTIEIFGDGQQLRDPVFIDDVTNAFLMAGAIEAPEHRVFNIGGPDALPLSQVADTISTLAGAPEPVHRPFPDDRKRIDIGSYRSDSTAILAALGWRAVTPFDQGACMALRYFRKEMAHYLRAEDIEPVCPLEEAQELQPVAVSSETMSAVPTGAACPVANSGPASHSLRGAVWSR